MNDKQNLNNMEVLAISKRIPYVIHRDEMVKIMTQSKDSQILENVHAEASELSITNRGEVGLDTTYNHISEEATQIPNSFPNLTTDYIEVLAIPKRTPYIIFNDELEEIKNRPHPVINPKEQTRYDKIHLQLIDNTKKHSTKKRVLTPKK